MTTTDRWNWPSTARFAPAGGVRVAAFDRRGHGRTRDTPEESHSESMVDDTIAAFDRAGPQCSMV